jgi:hypothetical protein
MGNSMIGQHPGGPQFASKHLLGRAVAATGAFVALTTLVGGGVAMASPAGTDTYSASANALNQEIGVDAPLPTDQQTGDVNVLLDNFVENSKGGLQSAIETRESNGANQRTTADYYAADIHVVSRTEESPGVLPVRSFFMDRGKVRIAYTSKNPDVFLIDDKEYGIPPQLRDKILGTPSQPGMQRQVDTPFEALRDKPGGILDLNIDKPIDSTVGRKDGKFQYTAIGSLFGG